MSIINFRQFLKILQYKNEKIQIKIINPDKKRKVVQIQDFFTNILNGQYIILQKILKYTRVSLISKNNFDNKNKKSTKNLYNFCNKNNDKNSRNFLLKILTLLIGFGLLSFVQTIEDHECFDRDTFDTCHTLNSDHNGTKPDFLCIWCEYWCVHNAKGVEAGACEEYSDKFAEVFDPPKIYDIQPNIILRNTPTLISIYGQHFDMHTSENIYNTVTEIGFVDSRPREDLEVDGPGTIKHYCTIHSINFSNIRCVLEGINHTTKQVNIPLRFYFKKVIYNNSEVSFIPFNYTVKLLNEDDHNGDQIDVNEGDKTFQKKDQEFFHTWVFRMAGSFLFGAILCYLIYINRNTAKTFISYLKRSRFIEEIKKTIKKQGLLIELEKCELQNKLGNGQFGHVFAAIVTEFRSENSEIFKGSENSKRPILKDQTIAIKQLKNVQNDLQAIRLFIEEGIRMSKIHHQNILTPIGITFNLASFELDPVLHKIIKSNNEEKAYKTLVNSRVSYNCPSIILPIMANGDLCRYLRSQKLFPIQSLIGFCRQIADGMCHLSSMKIVHGDLAARNCLLDENLVIKIADFGFTRRMYDCEEYSVVQRPSWPVRWMAPEQLSNIDKQTVKFTLTSDIWSFGVVMWEILTLGSHPYDELDDDNVLRYLQAGSRLASPVNCSENVLTLMNECWNEAPDRRPKFKDISQRLLLIENSIMRATQSQGVLSSYSIPGTTSLSSSSSSSLISLSSSILSASDSSLSPPSSLSNLLPSYSSSQVPKQEFLSKEFSNQNQISQNFEHNHKKTSDKFHNNEMVAIVMDNRQVMSNYTTLPDRFFANHDGRTLSSIN